MCKPTVVNVLKKLSDEKAEILYINNYKRITPQIIDTYNMFYAKKEIISPFKLIGNNTMANFSVKHIIHGKVKIHPIDAKEANLPNEIDAVKYINQTIIKDGKLNIKNITVIVNDNMAKKLKKINNFVVKEEPNNKMTLDLSVLPIATTSLNDIEILNIVKRVNALTMDKKIIEYILKDTLTINDNYTDEQKKVLAKYGLTNGVYSGINNEKQEATEKYMATEIKFAIKGMASIPSMNSVLASHKSGLKKTMYDRYEEMKNITKETLKTNLKNINHELDELKIKLTNVRCVKINNPVDTIVDDMTITFKQVEKMA